MDRDPTGRGRPAVVSQLHIVEDSSDASVSETVIVVKSAPDEDSVSGLNRACSGSSNLHTDEQRSPSRDIENGYAIEGKRSATEAETTRNPNNENDCVAVDSDGVSLHKAKIELACNQTEEEERKPTKKEEGSVTADTEAVREEKICRICHLGLDQSTLRSAADSSSTSMELDRIGCGCKEELGIAHRHCAKAWFELKGNRLCEICGQRAKNVALEWENEWEADLNDQRSVIFANDPSEQRRRRGWSSRRRRLCDIMIACLVIAFILPWLIHLNMF